MHVVITGASSGIGAGLARAWAARGAKLTLVARRRELLEELDASIGGGACIIVRDLADSAHATDWIAEAEAKHGPIEVLVNNAGVENIGLVVDSEVAESAKLLHLNLLTPLFLTRAVVGDMIARRSGTVVQISSVAGLVAPRGQAWYGASKAGLSMFGETLRAELRGTGVNVVTVYPGPVTTPMGDAAFVKFGGREGPAGRAPEGNVEDLARLVLRAVDKGSARVIYPRFYRLAWWIPWLSRWIAYRAAPLPLSPAEAAAALAKLRSSGP
jgi:short-subunit dehydrogenase